LKDFLDYNSPLMLFIKVVTIMFFNFLYNAIMYDPIELAERIRKDGGFIAGIRPGRKTAECFNYILQRIAFPGAIYIAALSVVPDMVVRFFNFPVMFSGLSVLIAVVVALDTAAQIESFLIERQYEGFLGSHRRIKGRRA
jgi:preprotein translocase subunit SecY